MKIHLTIGLYIVLVSVLFSGVLLASDYFSSKVTSKNGMNVLHGGILGK